MTRFTNETAMSVVSPC